jgi:hypothetical protein
MLAFFNQVALGIVKVLNVIAYLIIFPVKPAVSCIIFIIFSYAVFINVGCEQAVIID